METSGVSAARQITLLLPLGDEAAGTTRKPQGRPEQDHLSEARSSQQGSSSSCLPINGEDGPGAREDETGLK